MDLRRVLIAEDSKTQLMGLRKMLEKAGYEVSTASNGSEALILLRSQHHDLLISDVMMPVMDGYELCRAVKADEGLRQLPVVLLTALTDPGAVIDALEAGADNFIAKPYDEKLLLSSLSRIQTNLHLRKVTSDGAGVEVEFAGRIHRLNSSTVQTIDFLLSTFDNTLRQNQRLDETNKQLSRLERNYRQLLDTNMDAVIVVDDTDIVRYANPSALAMGPELFAPGQAFTLGINAGERTELELPGHDEMTTVAEMRIVHTLWNNRDSRLAVLRDVTEQVRMRERLRHLSLHDELTGLLNRRGFVTMGEKELSLAKRMGCDVCVAFIDLDGLKQVNDKLGHEAGDGALVDLATLMKRCFRSSDLLGRIGGDEFAVLGLSKGDAGPDLMVSRLRAAIEEHSREAKSPYPLSASIGCALCHSDDTATLEYLMSSADEKMYEEKVAKRRAV